MKTLLVSIFLLTGLLLMGQAGQNEPLPRSKIDAVDRANLTISTKVLKTGETQILQITSETRFFIDKNYVTTEELVAGDTITGIIHKRTDGVYKAGRIHITKPKLEQKVSRRPNSAMLQMA